MRSHGLPGILLVFTCAPSLAAADDCAATNPNGKIYGNDALAVVLPPDGKFEFVPNGPGFIDHDGALGIKVGWQRKIKGQIDVTGRRIDGPAARARAYIPYGYDDIGFQPSYVVFPTPGCWEIVARRRSAADSR